MLEMKEKDRRRGEGEERREKEKRGDRRGGEGKKREKKEERRDREFGDLEIVTTYTIKKIWW